MSTTNAALLAALAGPWPRYPASSFFTVFLFTRAATGFFQFVFEAGEHSAYCAKPRYTPRIARPPDFWHEPRGKNVQQEAYDGSKGCAGE